MTTKIFLGYGCGLRFDFVSQIFLDDDQFFFGRCAMVKFHLDDHGTLEYSPDHGPNLGLPFKF